MLYDFHPDAQPELENAVAYYDSINQKLGDAFLNQVEHTLERIVKFPEAWPKLSANTRRCRMVGYPYGIIYEIKNQKILVVAVMHLQRKPDYWTSRV